MNGGRSTGGRAAAHPAATAAKELNVKKAQDETRGKRNELGAWCNIAWILQLRRAMALHRALGHGGQDWLMALMNLRYKSRLIASAALHLQKCLSSKRKTLNEDHDRSISLTL